MFVNNSPNKTKSQNTLTLMNTKRILKKAHVKVKVNLIKIPNLPKSTVRVIRGNSLIMINQNLVMKGLSMNLTVVPNLTSKKTTSK